MQGILTQKAERVSAAANRRSLRKNGMGRRTPNEFEWYQGTHADVLTEKSAEDK